MNVMSTFPASWFVTVTVDRGAGGYDGWGDPLPSERFEVSECLLAPSSSLNDDEYGAVTDSDGRIYHASFVFEQSDLVTVPDGQLNAGVWEVQEPSAEWPGGTETRVRRVNQRG